MLDKRTSAAPKTVNGVTFHCYHVGIMQYEWRSEDERLCVHSNSRMQYVAIVDGAYIPGANPSKSKRFRTLEAAMLTATFRARA